jgi:transcriptional regulator with XRE-family HTH domain
MTYNTEYIGKIIYEERIKLGLSQNQLGQELNIVGKQISNYEKGKTIPPIEILFKLCKAFDCELGHLIGETDYSEGTRLETEISKITGLSLESMNNIRKITGNDKTSLNFGYESDTYRNILNSIFSSSHFIKLIECLYNLNEAVTNANILWENLEKEVGKDQFNKCLKLYQSGIDYINESENPTLNSEQRQIIFKIDSIIDKQNELEYAIKIARYELHEAFESLIESIYPR